MHRRIVHSKAQSDIEILYCHVMQTYIPCFPSPHPVPRSGAVPLPLLHILSCDPLTPGGGTPCHDSILHVPTLGPPSLSNVHEWSIMASAWDRCGLVMSAAPASHWSPRPTLASDWLMPPPGVTPGPLWLPSQLCAPIGSRNDPHQYSVFVPS